MSTLRSLAVLLTLFPLLMLSACSGGNGSPGEPPDSGIVEEDDDDDGGEDNVTIDQVLPLTHVCGPTLTLLAQAMTDTEFNASCATLAASETFFHERLQTGLVPVADDYNTALRIVVFDSYDEYDQHGYALFGINTDNGGIYIEGNPSDPDNEASFYAHEAQWLLPEFVIWNLEHEYVHYLEGRFVSYGGFNHFPGNMVWWTEGLAEYLSMGDTNPEVLDLLRNTLSQSQPRTLGETFGTRYGDGVDNVYSWTYLAVRFLFETHYAEVLAMTDTLKANNFASYQDHLAHWETNYEQQYQQWLQTLANSGAEGAPRPESRYLMLKQHALSEAQRRSHLLPP
ncbi:collagenase [Microbulbifer salipaludis]|uniref:Collagenase n=1 Tax=Microbulbifer salipaludis TaxID=187980 RepID=A0ABS3E6F0_9GAMM|nr:collagenase [Microbulbifer salipaludis]MBN8430878.1 collagenase [Microbulbifer salipaludis]